MSMINPTKGIINVKHWVVSEDTCAIALQEYFKSQPEPPYQFKAGDVVECGYGKRLIIIVDGRITAVEFGPKYEILEVIKSQADCERFGFEKIGVIADYIK